MEEYKTVYDKWINRLCKSYYVAAVVLVLMEITVFVALFFAGEVTVPINEYIITRILMPAAINFISIYIARRVIKNEKTKEKTKKFFAVLECFVMCEVVIIYHSYFTAVVAVLLLPILTSTIFGEEKILQTITALSMLGVVPYIYLQIFEYLDAPFTYHVLNYFVMFAILLIGYFFASVIIKYENEKNEKIKEENKILRQSNFEIQHDELTQVFNYGAFKRKLAKLMEAQKAEDPKKLYLAIIDIDNFRAINENLGFELGDNILKLVGTLLNEISEEVSYENMFPARLQGQEFAVLFSDLIIDDILEILSEYRSRLAKKQDSLISDSDLSFGTGIIEYTKDMNEEQFFERADKALIEAKAKGESQIVIVR